MTEPTELGQTQWSGYGDAHTIHAHREGCAAALMGTGCDCPGPRLYVALDAVLRALEMGYHPQNPTREHPADYLRRRFDA